MHKNYYNIKVAFSCNKNFSNSIDELKPFLGFDLKEIEQIKDPNSVNSENHVFILDTKFIENNFFKQH